MAYWEKIDNTTKRLKVPGGWIIRSVVGVDYSSTEYNRNKSDAIALHQIFVEDKSHKWGL